MGTEGVGFYKSDHQPKTDHRPYIQSGLFLLLGGNHPSQLSLYGRCFNWKPSVSLDNYKIDKILVSNSRHAGTGIENTEQKVVTQLCT